MQRTSPGASSRWGAAARSHATVALIAGLALAFAFAAMAARPAANPQSRYQSPFDVAFSPDGKTLAVSDYTGGALITLDAASGKLAKKVALSQPAGVAWSANGARVLVAERMGGTIAEVDPRSGKVLRRIPVGPRPVGIAVAQKRQLALTANATGSVSVVDLAKGKEAARIPTSGMAFGVAMTPDEKLGFVSNLFPYHAASDPEDSSSIGLIDLGTLKAAGEIRLPAGSVGVRQMAVSPDGKWLYVVHLVGRFNVPTTQLDRGWVNTNALSVIDLGTKQVYATVLLDHPQEGAADPWGLVLSKDGNTAWITLSGVHQIAKLDLAGLHNFCEGKIPEGHWLLKASAEYSASTRSTWLEIKKDPKQRAELVNDLSALYVAEVINKTPMPGNGLRGLSLSPDGQTLAVVSYFTGEVLLTDAATCKENKACPLGPKVAPDQTRKGEIAFHDATYCFQHWLSCATCHPDGRSDGLNWDLLNDGIGNPKNTRSLILAGKVTPLMSHGVRATMEDAALAGFRFILFREPEKDELEAVRAFLRNTQPEPSPYLLANGDLSPAAKRGKALFESRKTQCAGCHPAPFHTDNQAHDVGTRSELDERSDFYTPRLVELWRTGPYLHDGSCVTLKEVLSHNKGNKHGITSHLKPNEIDDLVAYMKTL